MIDEIIQKELLSIYFQPIISIRTKEIYGYEALIRCTYEGKYINPYRLFMMAKEKRLVTKLDILARRKAIEKFEEYYKQNNNLMLFLNIEASSIDSFHKDSVKLNFHHLIKELNIPEYNFVLEVKEDEIKSEEKLKEFCDYYKSLNYNIAVDDFGTGSSNYERLIHIKPDILKIDRSLFIDMEKNQTKQAIINSIVFMCNNLGIVVLSEGVENKDVILSNMHMDINLYQGYYFSEAKECIDKSTKELIEDKIVDIGLDFKNRTIELVKENIDLRKRLDKFSKKIIDKFIDMSSSEEIIKKVHKDFYEIEAIYLIDAQDSKQIHDTVISNINSKHFHATKHGHEHILKEYYYMTLESKDGIYLSNNYISSATGNMCKTFSKVFQKESKKYILCLDVAI